MTKSEPPFLFRVLVLSAVKHDYIAYGVASHPRFDLTVVADDADQPDWVHERNQKFADDNGILYIRDLEQAVEKFDPNVAVISSEAERHCDLSIRAANLGLHVIQDKPMSDRLSECDRLVEAVRRNDVRFLMWNRNLLPAVVKARDQLKAGVVGNLKAVHVDFYFAKDAGPPKTSDQPSEPRLDWLEALKAAHATGADGGVGRKAMGELGIEGCYPLGYVDMLTGSPVRRVFARTTSHFHQLYVDNDVEDLATVSFELENGVLGSLAIGRIGNAGHPDIGEIKIHLIGDQGAFVVSEARPEIGIYYRDQPATEFPNMRIRAHENDYLLAEDFANAIDQGRNTVMDVETSRAITAHGCRRY